MEENREEGQKRKEEQEIEKINNIIISFDIGIKNLGCCILEYNEQSNNANIIHWDLHNLVDENRKTKHNKARCPE